MAFTDDIVTVLSAASLGAVGTDIFIGARAAIPAGDGPYLSLIETGGTAPMERHDHVGTPYQQPSMQLVARAKGATVARIRARAAYNALVGIRNQTINGTTYLWIRPVQEPFDLGIDETGRRSRFVFNIQVLKTFS